MTDFPTADQIGLAVVTAARLLGDDPEAVIKGEMGCRSRHVVMDALMITFPTANRTSLATCLAYPTPRAGHSAVITAKKSKWWSDVHVDEVVGVLVAPAYGEQAE